MQPSGLQLLTFTAYPPLARASAQANLELLRQLPLPLLPILLREVSALDWKFPRERQDIQAQMQWLRGMAAPMLAAVVRPFQLLTLPAALSELDWVNDAPGYMEQLTATLWATHQMPAFREAAKVYAEQLATFQRSPAVLQGPASAQEGTAPQAATGHTAAGRGVAGQSATTLRDASVGHGSSGEQPYREHVRAAPEMPRLVMVVLAASLGAPVLGAVPYRSLRREGVLLDHVDPANGFATLQAHLYQRAQQLPAAYAHWHVDGAAPAAVGTGFSASAMLAERAAGIPETEVVRVGYDTLAPTRERLLARAGTVMTAGTSGPEELRTLMAHLTPEAAGLPATRDRVLAHFELSLLTEGSGTQIFSTTFVQWASRECLRRAQPATLLARYTPRQREQGMNDLLSGAPSAGPDAAGSRIDAEQAAWTTWLNLQRLPDAAQSRFLVWQEGSATAVVIGPGLPRGTTSTSPIIMPQVVRLLA